MENDKVVQIGQIDRTQNPNTNLVIRYATAFEHKLEMLKQEAKQHWKRLGVFSLILLGLSYWLQLQMGSWILWALGVFNFGFWIFFVHSFWTNPTQKMALAAFSSSLSVISFLISLVLPAIQTTNITVPKIGIAIVNPAKKDTTVILSSKGVTQVPHRKNIEASSAMFGDKNVKTVEDGRSTVVNASVEANEGKYETIDLGNGSFIKKPVTKNFSEKQTARASKPGEIETQRAWDYIKRFLPVAKVERSKYRIPVSIQLAQGLIESNAGNSRLSRTANNHFGIKTWDKKVPHVVLKDDHPNDMFRVYAGAWESWRDHSEFLHKDNYKDLHALSMTDYKGWAKGLKRCNYATEKDYAEILIRVIEQYQLWKFDEV